MFACINKLNWDALKKGPGAFQWTFHPTQDAAVEEAKKLTTPTNTPVYVVEITPVIAVAILQPQHVVREVDSLDEL